MLLLYNHHHPSLHQPRGPKGAKGERASVEEYGSGAVGSSRQSSSSASLLRKIVTKNEQN